MWRCSLLELFLSLYFQEFILWILKDIFSQQGLLVRSASHYPSVEYSSKFKQTGFHNESWSSSISHQSQKNWSWLDFSPWGKIAAAFISLIHKVNTGFLYGRTPSPQKKPISKKIIINKIKITKRKTNLKNLFGIESPTQTCFRISSTGIFHYMFPNSFVPRSNAGGGI